MRTLKISEAAALLEVSPHTLRGWERRFGYPTPHRSAGGHRLYTYGEIVALRIALEQGLSISSAISRAREALSTDTHTLVAALTAFDLDRADSAMELALGLRSVERAVEEVLLPAIADIGDRCGNDSAQWAFAARWADGWLRRALRLAPPAVSRLAILVGDATCGALDPDALAIRAFELFCARSGARVMALPVSGVLRLADVVESLSPDAAVIAGGHSPDDAVALWVQRVRAVAGPVPMALYRRPVRASAATTKRVGTAADAPFGAHRHLLALIERHRVAGAAATQERVALTVLEDDHDRLDALG